LLNEIAVTLERFVVAPVWAIVAASLFVLHTYSFDMVDISPILFITGPTKRCGKSKFLAILLRLVSRPFAASSATAAGIYRMIELHHPTLCIDEVDAFIHGDEQLRGLINSGHTRDAAFHLGCAVTGDKEFEPRRWSTWTPKIFSGIGRLAETIEDRAIIIEMVRRRKDEPCERLRHGTRFDNIPRKALRFVNDHAEVIQSGNPPLPDALNDRAADNWTPLLILADLAGGDWPAKARQAALALSGGKDGEAIGLKGQLLADIRDVFAAEGVNKLASKDMVERLAEIEGRPWAEYGKQRRPISANQLANLLRGFCVSSRTIRTGDGTAKGYDVDDFSDAFSRYLPGNELPKGNKVTSPVNTGENGAFQKVTGQACDVWENAAPANKNAGGDVVTSQAVEREEMLL
jgi:putative DNA primase/helicase